MLSAGVGTNKYNTIFGKVVTEIPLITCNKQNNRLTEKSGNKAEGSKIEAV
jgi:hypothetical protein